MSISRGLEVLRRSSIPVQPPTLSPRDRLRDVVELYMRTRLPGDLHPSFQIVNETAVATRPNLPGSSQTEPIVRTLHSQAIDGTDSNEDESFSIDLIYQDAESEKQSFAMAVDEYEKSAEAKYKTYIRSGETHTWEQVIEEVDRAAAQYNDKSSLWHKIRQGLRKFGEGHSAFDAWLGLLPTQSNYCSMLCGGLKLILKAAARLKELRESTSDALAKIPELLSNTQMILGAFKSKKLFQSSSTLYVATLSALGHIVKYYTQNVAKKSISVLFKQDSYERKLTDKIKLVKASAERFAELARICSYQKQEVLHREIKTNRAIIERTRSESAKYQETISQDIKTVSGTIHQGVTGIGDQLRLLGSKNEEVYGLVRVLKEFLASNGRLDSKTNDIRRITSPTSFAARFARRKMKREELQEKVIDYLDCAESMIQDDILILLRIGWKFPRAAQDRAVSLMQSSTLHTWITSSESAALLVNGNYNTSARQSPLSFVCAKLMDSVRPASSQDARHERNGIIALAFFCGQHLDSKDPDSGVAAVIRNLLAQLLSEKLDFDISIVRELLNLDPDDVQGLCHVFSNLILQIPPKTMVFCIIDAITFHENSSARSKDADKLVSTLLDLVQKSGRGCCAFKFLLTAPGTSRVFFKRFAKKDVIWMPKKISPQGGFTAMKWNRTAGRDVEDVVSG